MRPHRGEIGRRPTPSLAFVGPMVVLALILGLVLGAIAVWLYASRRLGVVERQLAGTRAELDVERRSFD